MSACGNSGDCLDQFVQHVSRRIELLLPDVAERKCISSVGRFVIIDRFLPIGIKVADRLLKFILSLIGKPTNITSTLFEFVAEFAIEQTTGPVTCLGILLFRQVNGRQRMDRGSAKLGIRKLFRDLLEPVDRFVVLLAMLSDFGKPIHCLRSPLAAAMVVDQSTKKIGGLVELFQFAM